MLGATAANETRAGGDGHPTETMATSGTPAADEFSTWLDGKLQALNTDESVFGSYILGILDGDESPEEKLDALEGILAEIVVS